MAGPFNNMPGSNSPYLMQQSAAATVNAPYSSPGGLSFGSTPETVAFGPASGGSSSGAGAAGPFHSAGPLASYPISTMSGYGGQSTGYSANPPAYSQSMNAAYATASTPYSVATAQCYDGTIMNSQTGGGAGAGQMRGGLSPAAGVQYSGAMPLRPQMTSPSAAVGAGVPYGAASPATAGAAVAATVGAQFGSAGGHHMRPQMAPTSVAGSLQQQQQQKQHQSVARFQQPGLGQPSPVSQSSTVASLQQQQQQQQHIPPGGGIGALQSSVMSQTYCSVTPATATATAHSSISSATSSATITSGPITSAITTPAAAGGAAGSMHNVPAAYQRMPHHHQLQQQQQQHHSQLHLQQQQQQQMFSQHQQQQQQQQHGMQQKMVSMQQQQQHQPMTPLQQQQQQQTLLQQQQQQQNILQQQQQHMMSQQQTMFPQQQQQQQSPQFQQHMAMQQQTFGQHHQQQQQLQQQQQQQLQQQQQQQQQQREFNAATLCRYGQEYVQDLVVRCQELFSQLRLMQPPNGTVQGASVAADKQAKIHQQLECIRMVLSRLRYIHDRVLETCAAVSQDEPQCLIPYVDDDNAKLSGHKDTEQYKSALQEFTSVKQQVVMRNRYLKDIIGQMRSLVWDVNTMMAMKGSS